MVDADQICFTQDLIRTQSFSGAEKAAADKIAAEMRRLGYDKVMIDENGSVIGLIVGSLPGKTLLLDGHCDTVSANAADWRYPPYEAVIENEVLYGRGASDMKGSLAAIIYAASQVDRARLAGTVAVSTSVIEENMEGGALRSICDLVKPDFVVIGEATNFSIKRGGRGRAEVMVTTYGKSAHSSSPEAGLCAVHEMIKAISAIDSMPVETHPVVGRGLNVLVDIKSDPYPGHSVLPNTCQATYDRRLLPGETIESVLESISALPALREIKHEVDIVDSQETTYTGKVLSGKKFFPAWVFDEDNELLQRALAGLIRVDITPSIGAFQFCTNGAYTAGIAGIPTIGFGPGGESDAHTVDEHISLADLIKARKAFTAIIEQVLS